MTDTEPGADDHDDHYDDDDGYSDMRMEEEMQRGADIPPDPEDAAPAEAGEQAGGHAQLLAEAIDVLTRAARLTRPVLTRDEAASAAGGTPVWVESGKREPADWAEFVAAALAGAAANAGGIETVLAGRPGSWEADGVRQLLVGTLGHDEEYLLQHRTEPVTVTLYVSAILTANGAWQAYDDAQATLSARWATLDADASTVTEEEGPGESNSYPGRTVEYERQADALAELEDRLEQQQRQDWAAYGEALRAAVAAAAAAADLPVPVVATVELDTVPEIGDMEQPWTIAGRLESAAVEATPLPGEGRSPLERLTPDLP